MNFSETTNCTCHTGSYSSVVLENLLVLISTKFFRNRVFTYIYMIQRSNDLLELTLAKLSADGSFQDWVP